MIFSFWLSAWLLLVCVLVLSISSSLCVVILVLGLVVLFSGFEFFSEISLWQVSSYMMVDSISCVFVVLSIFVSFVSVMAMVSEKNFFGVLFLFLLMNFLLVGLFCQSYLFAFFVLLELSIIPIFLILSYWGSYKERLYSGYYFIFYAFMTPMPLLLCIGLLMSQGGGLCYFSDVSSMSLLALSGVEFVAIVVGFLSKLPLYGLHIWLPKAHVDAPVGGSMVLAGILLKMGSYGLMRLLFLEGFGNVVSYGLMSLGLLGCLLGGVLCVRLVDFKVIVAFSSVCHMSMGFGGLVPLKFWGVWGSFLMFVGHGVVSPALFFISGLLYSRSGTRMVRGGTLYGNFFLGFFVFMVVANFGFPPIINFFSEVGIFWSLFGFSVLLAVISFLSFFFAGIYMMTLFTSINASHLGGTLSRCECLVCYLLVVGVVFCSVSLFFYF